MFNLPRDFGLVQECVEEENSSKVRFLKKSNMIKKTGSHNPQEHPDSDLRTKPWPLARKGSCAQVCHPRKQTLTCGSVGHLLKQ